MTTPQQQIRIGALFIALGVGCGAFGAHGLKQLISPAMLAVYEKGVFYHLIHGLGLLFVALLTSNKIISAHKGSRIFLTLAAGIFFFSGSLYLLAITGKTWLGAVTPLGGILFIASWMQLAFSDNL